MKKLAVLNCKAKKHNHVCSAEHMYSKSQVFRAQREFVIHHYDSFVILSAEHGVLMPSDIIAPYNTLISSSGYSGIGNEEYVLSEQQKQEWAAKIIEHPIWYQYDKIDFHIGNEYWAPISPFFTNHPSRITKINLPTNLGLCVQRYRELDIQWTAGDYSVDILTESRPTKESLEQPRFWYHPNNPPFFGTCKELYTSQCPDNDYPTLCRVGAPVRGIPHAKGWCVDQSLLPYLIYNETKNQWRLIKPK